MKTWLIVFIGSGLGGVVRFLLGKQINSWHATAFPFGTLAINILACLILGVLMQLAVVKQVLSANQRLLWAVGFCGGFSTFSTFGYELITLLQQQQYWLMAVYLVASLVLGVAAVGLGMYLTKLF